MDLRQFHKEGQLMIRDFDRNEISPGEFGKIAQGKSSPGKNPAWL